MNKKDTIKLAACYAGTTVKAEQRAIEGFLCAISDLLANEEEVVIPDFGRFTVKEYAASRYRHPKTGEIEVRPATKRVKFKPFDNIALYSIKYGR